MKIKPRKIKRKQGNIVYRGNGEYSVLSGSFHCHEYIGDDLYQCNDARFSLNRLSRMVSDYGRFYSDKESLASIIRSNLEEQEAFEQKRLMLEQLDIIVPPDKIS